MRFKGSQQGNSNSGYWVKNPQTGELSYVKYPRDGAAIPQGLESSRYIEYLRGSDVDSQKYDLTKMMQNLYGKGGQATSEALAADLYRAAGFESPEVRVVADANGNVGTSSSFMTDLEAPTAANIQAVREGFATDCWLANWDALKDGNVFMHNGNAVRLDVGGSLCYRARGGRKGVAFQENVDELTSFFGPKSLSKKYIEGMTRDELLQSLKHVTQIDDATITQLVAKAEANGMKNPAFMREMLMERRDYLRRFEDLCQRNPIRNGENIESYVTRIARQTPRVEYNVGSVGFDNIMASARNHGEPTEGGRTSMDQFNGFALQALNQKLRASEFLIPSQKRLVAESYSAFETSSGRRIEHNAGNVLTTDNLLHATDIDALDGILQKGAMSGEYSGRTGSALSDKSQPGSRTPLCLDTWEVQGNYSINDYFSNRRPQIEGEGKFMPHQDPFKSKASLVIVFDKTTADPTLINNSFKVSERNSILYQDGNMGGYTSYTSHRAIPVGLPANTIDRIIVPNKLLEQKDQILNMVQKSGLDIKVYDIYGNLLSGTTKR